MQQFKTDVVILGGGPAGLTAALYILREQLTVTIVEKEALGGNLNMIPRIENYPGFSVISGQELASKLIAQIEAFPAVHRIFDSIVSLVKEDNLFLVKCKGAVVEAKSVIVATGASEKRLGIPGEEQFIGRGVSYCALCDGPFFKKKIIAVVGSGDRAYTEAINLAKFAQKVYLLQRKNTATADLFNVSRAKEIENIEIITNTTVGEIVGDTVVTGIVLDTEGRRHLLGVNGVFPLIGIKPNSDFLKGFDILDDNGFIKVDANCMTDIEGLYAVGDVIQKQVRQISTAVGEGAVAGVSVARLRK